MVSDKRGSKLLAWLKIARLQFYPMTWIAYTVGAAAWAAASGEWRLTSYLLGYLVLFLIELCTILTNEYFDYPSDRQNNNFSIFTGGTRVLVNGDLSFSQVRNAILVILAVITILSYSLVKISAGGSHGVVAVLILIGLFFGLGYTVPPLKLSYRGAGELVVGLTHSIYVILCGYVFQGGHWKDPLPWFISVPLFFAVLGGNTLAGIPDRQADNAVMKKSIAVMYGSQVATMLAIWSVCMAFLSALFLWYFQIIHLSLFYWFLLALPNGLVLIIFLFRLLWSNAFDRRIDRVMALALCYIIWFGLLPLISFWR
ncbi:MAG TPA: prenyltransferase [Syntrophales bacterium]|nr:prenyltransferase [Syntrophales bacterium]